VLQLDAPDLALERQIMFVDQPLEAFLDRVKLHIEALNRALINIPPGYTSFRSSIWISRSRRPASKWEKSISGLRD
jgi:hypothetical protein